MTIRGSLKIGLSMITSSLAFPIVLGFTDAGWLEQLAVISFFCLLGVSASMMRFSSYLIIFILIGIGFAILPQWPDEAALSKAGQFVLVFGCLVPVLALVRATATTMPSVASTQNRLGQLPAPATASGLQVTSHMLGGVLNIGTFALISASLPQNADEKRRKIAAEATLRGMNAAVLWSPFFVSFAVAGAYLPSGYAAGAILAGIITALCFLLLSLAAEAKSVTAINLFQSMRPLAPIASRLVVIFLAVSCIGVMFNLTALLAVILSMPLLCMVQMARRPDNIIQIWQAYCRYQRSGGDELVIISTSMIIAVLASDAPVLISVLQSIWGEQPAIWLKIAILPVVVWAASVAGVHPVISSAPLLAFFAPSLTSFDAIFVMQAHMIGWAAGTMTSFSSMSVITVAEQFSLRPMQLAFGRNLYYSAALAAGGGGVWALVYLLLSG